MDLLKDFTSFLKTARHPLLVILGPTASGKTGFSISLARHFHGEIISTDSRQIYQQMPIATDLISEQERQGITHHLLDFVSPEKTLSLAEYHDLAIQKIAEIEQRKKLPILVGGTGLYISSIIEGYQVPRIPPDEKLRQKLYAQAAKKGPEFLHKKLAKLDPQTAAKIHPNNLRYVIRALEINLTGGHQKKDQSTRPDLTPYIIGLDWSRDILYERINQRVDRQLERGLIDEVRALLRKKYHKDLPAMSSLGVKEIIPYLEGHISLEEAVETLKKNTRNYAKRQLTWFRRYDKMSPGIIHWLKPSEVEKIIEKIAEQR